MSLKSRKLERIMSMERLQPSNYNSLALSVIFMALSLCVPFYSVSVWAQSSSIEQPLANINNNPFARFAEGEELIITLQLDRMVIAEVFAYSSNNGVLLPFEQMMDALEFAVDRQGNVFTGWYIKEANLFELGLVGGRWQVTNGNRVSAVETGLIREESDDTYVHSSLFTDWFNIDYEFESSDQVLILKPQDKLPLQLLIERRKRDTIDTQTQEAQNTVLPWNYQALSPQTADLALNYTRLENANDGIFNYSLVGARDFAFLSSQFFASGVDDDWLREGRFRLFSRNRPFQLAGTTFTEFSVGDIQPLNTIASNNTNLGVGFHIANRANPFGSNTETTIITGNIQNGWDVELYRGSVLIDSQFDIQDGQYRFVEVPLNVGVNRFTLELYGPQGQRLTQTIERILNNALDPGESTYGVSVNKLSSSLLGNDVVGPDGYQLVTDFNTGITDNASVSFATSSVIGAQDAPDVFNASLGVNLFLLDSLSVNTAVRANNNDEFGFSTSLRTNVLEHSLSTSFAVNRGPVMDSREDLLFDDIENRSFSFRHDGQITLLGQEIGLDNQFNLSTNNVGLSNFIQRNAIGLQLGGYNLQGGYYRRDIDNTLSGINTSTQAIDLGIKKGIRGVFMRFNASYDLDEKQVSTFSSDISWSLAKSIRAKLTHSYNFLNDNSSSLLNLSWQNDIVGLTASTGYSDISGWRIGLNASTGLAFTQGSRVPIMQRTSFTSFGTVVATVFHDINFNGVLDDADEAVEGVKLKAVQSSRFALTDASGQAVLTNLTPFKATDIEIDQESLDDAFLVQGVKRFAVMPREGHVVELLIPVVSGNEIDGVLSIENEVGNLIPGNGVPVELLNSHGEVINSTKTQFDGFYLFTGVLPGQYEVRINPDYADTQLLANAQAQNIVILPDDFVSSGHDLASRQLVNEQLYFASVGYFKDSSMLKLYRNLLNQRLRGMLTKLGDFTVPASAVISDNNQTSGLHLAVARSASKAQLTDYCARFASAGVQCSVEEYAIKR